ncbi:unnamed protein product, partial [Owenia fusiformis]
QEVRNMAESEKSPRPNGDAIEQDSTPTNNGADKKTNFMSQIRVQQLRDKAQNVRGEIIDQLDSQLNDLIDDFTNGVDALDTAEGTVPARANGHYRQPSHHRGPGNELEEKVFQIRRSVLTELLQINHIRTIYHIFIAIMIIFSLNTMLYDIIEKGYLSLEFEMMLWAFGKLPQVMYLWTCMSISTLAVYPVFNFWANNRIAGPTGLFDNAFIVLYIIYMIAFLVWPVTYINMENMPPASSVTLACEQVRLVMKTHAFVRENWPRARNYKPHSDDDNHDEGPCPDFGKYLYFLFAPTLIYRDSYPRTKSIRWNYVVSNFAQVWACMFYVYYIFQRFCVPVFRNFSQDHVTVKALILSVFNCMLPGTLVLFIAFFAVLHSWLNAFAEMLRFGDRLFYKDWWNATSFATYYRTWNVVVHDWLYTYIYKDFFAIFGARSSVSNVGAKASVFLLSAIFHEYILTVSFRFFYPVLFVLFAGAGFLIMFLRGRSRGWNVFMWVGLFMGTGILMCLYSMEWYARQDCPIDTESWLNEYLVPKSLSCDFLRMHEQQNNITEKMNKA